MESMDNTIAPLALDRISNDIINNLLTIGKTPVEEPVGVLLGGQPGAGKSYIIKNVSELYKQNIVVINADEYRIFHPKFEELHKIYGKDDVLYTQKFSGSVTEMIINKLSDKKYNLIIEGTLRTTEVPLNTQKLLHDKGYNTELHVIAVKPLISYCSTIFRYELMLSKGLTGRMTPQKHHDDIVKSISDNLDSIYSKNVFQNIVIMNRNQECLFNQKDGVGVLPGSVLKNVFNSKWSISEVKQIRGILEKTSLLMENRQAPDLKDFKYMANNILEYISKNSVRESIKNKLNLPNR